VIVLDEVSSTNSWVRDHFSGLEDGTLVAARKQSAGRGRLGRRWISPPGTNFTGTVKLAAIREGYHAGAVLGLAALDTVRRFVPGEDFFFKWPNDIYCGKCKLAGILCDGVLAAGGVLAGVAAGIGINVNMDAGELALLERPATSLFLLSGEKINLEKFALELEKNIKKWYIKYDCSCAEVLEAWRHENTLLGHRIEVVAPRGKVISGIFTEIAEDGALTVLSDDGIRHRFDCGDVSMFQL